MLEFKRTIRGYLSKKILLKRLYRLYFCVKKLGKAGFCLKKGGGDRDHWLFQEKKGLAILVNKNYPYIAFEIFCDNLYQELDKKIVENQKYVVFDIGSNRAYTSLFFSQRNWCEKVYAFELIQQTYEEGLRNVELNQELKGKIKTFNFGLGSSDGLLKAYYLPQRDGISTISAEFLEQYAPGVIGENNLVCEIECPVRKASAVFREIVVEGGISDNLIIKIDCEGAEYEILGEIADNYPDIFDNVKFIIGEAHMGLDKLNEILFPIGFLLLDKYKTSDAVCPFLYFK